MPLYLKYNDDEIPLMELSNIVKETRNFEGQYIFLILNYGIEKLGIKEEEVVLRLSKEEKFFGV